MALHGVDHFGLVRSSVNGSGEDGSFMAVQVERLSDLANVAEPCGVPAIAGPGFDVLGNATGLTLACGVEDDKRLHGLV
jgi:hypothetical protein